MMQILDFLSLRNLLSNELFFTFYEFATAHLMILVVDSIFYIEKILFLLYVKWQQY